MRKYLMLGALAILAIATMAGQTAQAMVRTANGTGIGTASDDPPLTVDGGWQAFYFGGVERNCPADS